MKRSFFGQLRCTLVLKILPTPQLGLSSPLTVIYAIIEPVKVKLEHNLYYYRTTGAIEIADLSTVQCLVGRVLDRDCWSIIDRSGISMGQVE